MSNVLENQRKVAQRLLETEAIFNTEHLGEYRTDDCTHQLLPRSLGHPPRNNTDFVEFCNELKPLWTHYKINVLQAMHNVDSHKSVIYVMNRSETPVGPFEMESVFMLTVTEEGTKVRKVEEIVDSEHLIHFLAKVPKSEGETS